MADWGLEDKFLRKNIPGRYSTHWDKDSDEGSNGRADSLAGDSEDGSDDDDDPGPELPPAMSDPEPMRYGEAPGARAAAGAKGILAQHKYFKKMQHAERIELADERSRRLLEVARGSARGANAPPPPPPRLDERAREALRDARDAAAGDDSDATDEDEDAFLADYRKMRLAALQARFGMPTFGTYRTNASKEEYLEALDVDPRAVVVVHLYEPTYPPCRALNAALALLAARRRDVSFLGMRLDEAGDHCRNWDSEVLPVLAVYQAGEVKETLFMVGQDIGRTFDHADIESLLDTVPCFTGDDKAPAGAPAAFNINAAAPVATFHEGQYDDKKYQAARR